MWYSTLWPGLLERLLPRLDHVRFLASTAWSSTSLNNPQIAYHDFPVPSILLSEPVAPPVHAEYATLKASPPSQPSSQSSQKENQPTASPTLPTTSVVPPSGNLPPPLITLLNTVKSSLNTTFQASPPHTAQRLAELLLRPTLHYRTLPSYLRALDRIVSVSSPLSAFPLATISSASPNPSLLNGASSPGNEQEDETLSGATLTPISWLRPDGSSPSRLNSTSSVHPHPQHHATASDLRTESTTQIDGPNGAGSIETVTVAVNGLNNRATTSSVANGTPVTQGELLRQEQEAGVVPVPVQTHMISMAANQGRVTRSTSANAAQMGADVEDGMPSEGGEIEEGTRIHARGPDVIGMEDMGPQSSPAGIGGLDIEGAVGRRGEGEGILFGNNRTESRIKADENNGDSNFVVTNADGVAEGEAGADPSGQNVGGDAADGSTVTQ